MNEESESDGGHEGVKYNKYEKNLIGNVFASVKRLKMDKRTFQVVFADAGYPVPKSTLNDWIQRVKHGGDAVVMESNASGRPPKLDETQLSICMGMVVDMEDQNKLLTLKALKDFVSKNFGIDISTESLRRILNENGFSLKQMKKNISVKALSNDDLAKLMLEFIKDTHTNIFTGKDVSLRASIDCTYTSRNKKRARSWGTKGKPAAR